MAIENVDLMSECFPKHTGMGKAKKKYDIEIEKDKKRGVSMERITKAGTKEKSPDSQSLPNQNTILINIIYYYFPRYGKSTMEFD